MLVMSQIPETINPRDLLGDMPDSEIELHTRTVAGGVRPACGMSLRTLRCSSGHSLRSAAKIIRRAFNTLSDWENCTSYPQPGSTSYANLPLLLRQYGVPPKLLVDAFGSVQLDESLNAAEYLSRDALGIAELELAYMTSKRGAVLMSITHAALNGSSRHAQIWFDRLAASEREVLQRKSVEIQLSNRNNRERAKWLEQSRSKGSSSEPKPSSEQRNGSNGSRKKTPEPFEKDPDVQPSDIPGV